jgi:hypothetical protein
MQPEWNHQSRIPRVISEITDFMMAADQKAQINSARFKKPGFFRLRRMIAPSHSSKHNQKLAALYEVREVEARKSVLT